MQAIEPGPPARSGTRQRFEANSHAGTKRWRVPLRVGGSSCFLLLLVLCRLPLGAEPPVRMAPYRVSEAMLDIKVGIMMAQNFSGQWVKSMWIRSVKPHSASERAGLVRGMEVVAIQGQSVRGLSQPELAQVLQQFVGDRGEVVLLVQRSPGDPEVEKSSKPFPIPRPGAII
jgi:hypothetical protein